MKKIIILFGLILSLTLVTQAASTTNIKLDYQRKHNNSGNGTIVREPETASLATSMISLSPWPSWLLVKNLNLKATERSKDIFILSKMCFCRELGLSLRQIAIDDLVRTRYGFLTPDF